MGLKKMELFEKKTILLSATQSPSGVMTFISPELSRMDEAYKNQLKEFLNGAIKSLSKGK